MFVWRLGAVPVDKGVGFRERLTRHKPGVACSICSAWPVTCREWAPDRREYDRHECNLDAILRYCWYIENVTWQTDEERRVRDLLLYLVALLA